MTFLNRAYGDVFDPDGKYYIPKTYASEIGEYSAQLVAINVYACSFPVWLTVVFYTFLAFEAFVITLDTFWTMQSGSITVRRRNNRVMADVVLEVLSSTIPLIIMRFGYNFEFMDISEFNKVALVPACFAITKIYEITEAILRERAIQYRCSKERTKRLSFFPQWNQPTFVLEETDENKAVAQEQMRYTPGWVHVCFGVLSLLYGLFLLSLVVVQIVSETSIDCSVGTVNKKVWDSCDVKVPFCKKMFSPSCDCAKLNVQGHNWTTLPHIIGGMTAMKVLRVSHGPLKHLPGLTELTKLVHLNLNFNRLDHVPGGLGELKVGILELQ
eukprot:Stramenopile-MAST_4_protein_3114